MLARSLYRPLRLRLQTLTLSSRTPSSPPLPPSPRFPLPSPTFTSHFIPRAFSAGGTNNGGDDGGGWRLSPDNDGVDSSSVFGEEGGELSGIGAGDEPSGGAETLDWKGGKGGDVFGEIDQVFKSGGGGGVEEWETAEGYKPWTFDEEGKAVGIEFEGGAGLEGISGVGGEAVMVGTDKELEKEERELTAVLKGPNRAFGDLIAASGITEEMLDSLILLKNLKGVPGLPPLSEIEDIRLAKTGKQSARFEIERTKQEEIKEARARVVDAKGRAYGTGRRKCGIARVWIQPGDGNFIVNDKQIDAHFPILDHRAHILRPFSETKTLGQWDIKCTVKGGGVSGQAGAIRLGISRALQNWEPGLRQYLKPVGLLTRDSRVVERKKPGKAKARKSFQWVKR
ncbi:hypothetical protein QJS04_geneDACA000377 [Acorus gramineus]|uniref:Mitochondrial ribosomal protein S9 n=1 Tax=Acorus gramineus TaxID=55184 RepID=A0AAV9APT2_ACOGR|nr:hypothetical protein QJS04_geneDACA000377 [Acorus gramineus]